MGVIFLSLAAPAGAQLSQAAQGACACPSPGTRGDRAGVVWSGTTPPTAGDVIRMLAPVLWFSPDEPLLKGNDARIPAPHPCDRPSDRAVVYYQITDVHLLGNQEATLPVEEDPELFRKARALVVRYFFYYPEDQGLSPHRHDLEAVDVEL